MFDIDKERLGAFIAELRKEKGYEQSKIIHNRRQWIFIYLLCLFLCLAEIILLYLGSQFHIDYFIFIGMSVFFGAYFCIFAKPKLPTYYDENKINIYSDGIFRMNVPGVSFNNSNWPHVLQAIRFWSVISMAGYPILCFLTAILLPDELLRIGSYGILILYLAGLFIPVYHAGRKYQ